MTVQEAIKDIQDNIKPIVGGKSLEMAIEALTHFNSTSNSINNELNELSCSEKPNRSEPKTAESGSVDSEQSEIETDRTMSGMIYRQDAIDVAKQHWYKPDIAKALEELPSAQPERKNGEWIRGDAEKLTGKWRCSICGNTIYSETKRDREKFHAFCGHCGADMRPTERNSYV